MSKPTIVLPITQIYEIAFLCMEFWVYFMHFWDQWDVFLRSLGLTVHGRYEREDAQADFGFSPGSLSNLISFYGKEITCLVDEVKTGGCNLSRF